MEEHELIKIVSKCSSSGYSYNSLGEYWSRLNVKRFIKNINRFPIAILLGIYYILKTDNYHMNSRRSLKYDISDLHTDILERINNNLFQEEERLEVLLSGFVEEDNQSQYKTVDTCVENWRKYKKDFTNKEYQYENKYYTQIK